MGYYTTPIDRIFQGINTAMGLAALVKSFQDAAATRESNEATALAKKVELAKAISGQDQPTPLEGGLGQELEKKLGIKLPRQTPETLAQTQDTTIRAQAQVPEQPVQSLGAPGGIQTSIGGRMETVGREQGREPAEGLAATMPVGGYKPLMPAQKKVGIMAPGGKGIETITLPPGVKEIIQPKAEQEHAIYDQASGKVIPTGKTKVSVARPFETPQQRLDREKELETHKSSLKEKLADKSGKYTGELKMYVDTLNHLGAEPLGENGNFNEEQLSYVKDFFIKNKKDPEAVITQRAHAAALAELKQNDDYLNEKDMTKKAAIFNQAMDFHIGQLGGKKVGGAGAGKKTSGSISKNPWDTAIPGSYR